MDLESILDLPAHPLVVHAAVVLLPLAAIGTLVVAAAPRARRHYAPLALAAALAATVAVGLAQTSGEALEDEVRETGLVEEHTEQGESVLPWAIAVTVVAGAVTAVSRRKDTPDSAGGRRAATTMLILVALVAGIGATWSVVDVGHSGAKATWTTVQDTGTGDDDD